MIVRANWNVPKIGKENPRILNLVYVLFLCVIFISGAFVTNFGVEKQEITLLLNSGLTTAQEAEIRVVLWFERRPPLSIIQSLPHEGWEWKESELKASDLVHPYTLSGYKVIHREEEKRLTLWFQGLSKDVQDYGGTVYLDERIPEGIDIVKYYVQQGITPLQWALSGNTLSVAGKRNNLYPLIRAGTDSINIQLLSKSNEDRGRTVLAIPVLLEEF